MTVPISGSPQASLATNIELHLLEYVDTGRIYDVLRPELYYNEFFPAGSMSANVPPGALDFTRFLKDWAGKAAFRAAGSNDVSLVTQGFSKVSTPIFHGAIAHVMDSKDAERQTIINRQVPGLALGEDIGNTLMRAVEYHKELLYFFGDFAPDGSQNFYYPGILNNPEIPVATVSTNAAGTSTKWVDKTPDETSQDITDAITTMTEASDTLFTVTDIYLPVSQLGLIASTKAGLLANDQTIWKFTSTQNLTTAISDDGRVINFHMMRYLKGAGVGGTDRMMVVNRKPEYFMMCQPVDFKIKSVREEDFAIKTLAEYELSPVFLPYPTMINFHDGI